MTHEAMKPDNISLRDWFAGMAMQGLISRFGYTSDIQDISFDIADKMMKERLER